MVNSVECVLWDFGDTLADEKWLAEAPAAYSNWTEVYRQLVSLGQLGTDWNLCNVGTEDVAGHLAAALSADAGFAADHLRRRCADITFHGHAMKAVRSCDRPQSIVTLNPDIFSECVVPNYGLDALFETIVTSWEENTRDKSDLCDIALQRLGGVSDRSRALLIDNRIENVESWRARGGLAHHFVGNDAFAFDPPDLFKDTLQQ